ncbi:MAG: 6-carboxytetrahydropterin synthase QueD [Candidatus Acidulodesulfobacterium ferriphilum]|jgi:queuosine biosynthesis protein QueD|uniref:6-carboxy-5,6,7,8-tetrahydropterin synthase n=1 Tax=Candidatus Acidulodesulfobacterium ferriphilum TaxID=2597223 RepID=A0A519BCV3_9DELT|nr:MAG: 6-carboxytetrahydropterin synthase QueD [Candidatus Acidulodesulfobacterium ferriphilum]
MYELKVLSSFSSAHALRGYNGKCENIHGHNWRVETTVTSNVLNEIGLVIDFKLLKKYVDGVMEILDHKFINELDFFKEVNPSAENIARYIYEELEKIIGLNEYNECKDIRITRVDVYETSSSMASYRKN